MERVLKTLTYSLGKDLDVSRLGYGAMRLTGEGVWGKHVGLSEVSIADITRAEKILPIVSVQNMYNLGERKWDEVVDYTAKRNIAFIPWYPLASDPGQLSGKLEIVAARHKATPAQIALAWLLHRSPNIIVIPGTTSINHLLENIASARINLSGRDFQELG